jgi:PAS domain S-box-containing protein
MAGELLDQEMDVLSALRCMAQSCPAPCRSILDHIADGVLTIDTKGTIFWFNRAAEQITGYRKEEVLGRPCHEVLKSDHCMGERCPLKKTLATETPIVDMEMEIEAKDGHRITISVSTSVIRDDKGKVLGAVETFRDLSHLKLMQKNFYERYSFHNIISKNSKMNRIFRTLRDISLSDSTVLLQGESGTGKELMALAIHNLSHRRNKPYIAVNCGSIPATLLESELFGYVRGAFTDARHDKPGRFALAEGGTLFLDEVGDLSLEVQSKLLRVLQNGEYQPLGSTKTFKADVRIISATHRDLYQMVREGRFREDLYYRLNVVRIEIPSLRERREDIPLLIEHFIEKFNKKMGKSIRMISKEALEILQLYDFPGNVRELENIMEYAFILAKGRVIQPEHLPSHVLDAQQRQVQVSASGSDKANHAGQRETLLNVLKAHRWNKTSTARALGISRTTLWRRMRKAGIVDGNMAE